MEPTLARNWRARCDSNVRASFFCGPKYVIFRSHSPGGSVMPDRTCRKCSARGHFLEQVSRYFSVDYYRCPQCGHVWVHQRNNPDSPPEDVTFRDVDDSEPPLSPPSVPTRQIHSLSTGRRVSPGPARTQCPECGGPNILELQQFNRTSSTSDYFRCRSCGCWWPYPAFSAFAIELGLPKMIRAKGSSDPLRTIHQHPHASHRK